MLFRSAEYGVAAHSIYKDRARAGGGYSVSKDTNAYAWLRRTIEALSEGDNPEEFLENTKLELFQDQVFCFTPKGMLIALPRGATPIDFAYAVHTSVGDSCIGAKINGRNMPVVTRLNNGDEVEIIRGKTLAPPPAWESVVVTGKARSAIRRATRLAIRKQYSGLGQRIVESAFQRAGKTFDRDSLKRALPRLAHKEVEDMLAAVGRGETASTDVLRAVFPEFTEPRAPQPEVREEGWTNLRSAAGLLFRMPGRSARKTPKGGGDTSKGVPIRGAAGNVSVTFAPEGAVPGDRIVGILTPGAGITVYPIHSEALSAFDDQSERWIDVRWDVEDSSRERFPARIRVTAINEPGSLADIAGVIAGEDANIHTLSMTQTAHDFTEMRIDLEVYSLKHLSAILSRLRERSSVSKVERF